MTRNLPARLLPARRPRVRLLLVLLAAVAAACASPGASPAWADGPADGRFLYVARAAKDRDGFRHLKPSIEVHAIDDGHKLVRVIPLPPTVLAVRGLCGSAATGRLYVAHYGRFNGKSPQSGYSMPDGGRLLCLDLATDAVVWDKPYLPSADRMAVTPDGSKVYFPAGEERGEPTWLVVDGRTGDVLTKVAHLSSPHNTLCSLDGRLAFLQAFGKPSQKTTRPKTGDAQADKTPVADEDPADDLTHANGFQPDDQRTIAVVDTATDTVVRRVGPFMERTRPFTINGRASLLFVTTNDLIGFQVADVATGKVLFTAAPPAEQYKQPAATNNSTYSHGIGMTADESEVWVVDQRHIGLHVFDATGLPERSPVWKQFVKTRTGRPDIFGQPGWIMSTIDGRYFYPETGEVVDTTE